MFDTNKKRLVLDKAGEYEFKVVYLDKRGEQIQELESNVVRVKVTPIPVGEEAAFKLYADEGVARLVQRDRFYYSWEYHNAIKSALLLAESYPLSIYTDHLSDGQYAHLHRVIASPHVSDDQMRLHNALRKPAKENLE
ncbi:MAG: hypothetical protein AB1489_12625 [Acidobacteriota bacterium]